MISLRSVTKVYRNGVTALEDVSVEVEKGEFIFVVGQSGSGKSTLIRLLLKEEEATKGSVYVAGKNLAKITSWKVPYLRRNIGTVFQDYKLLSDKTVFYRGTVKVKFADVMIQKGEAITVIVDHEEDMTLAQTVRLPAKKK